MIKSWDTKSIIKTKNIDALKQKYLRKVGACSNNLDLPKAEELFQLVVKDFKKGDLSFDDLSNFGFYIFHTVAKHHPSSGLLKATLSASELNFVVRSPSVYSNLELYLKDIDKFFEKRFSEYENGKTTSIK